MGVVVDVCCGTGEWTACRGYGKAFGPLLSRKLADSHPSPLSLSVQEPAEDVAEGEGGVPAGGAPPRWCQETICGWT